MIINFIKAFVQASNKERIEFFRYVFKRIKERFIAYWLGDVSVFRHYISSPEFKKDKLYTISIVPSRFKKGAWFSDIDAKEIQNIINGIKNKPAKKFLLHQNMGCGYLEYTFNSFQQKLLLNELEKILKEEDIYIESD